MIWNDLSDLLDMMESQNGHPYINLLRQDQANTYSYTAGYFAEIEGKNGR